MSLRAAGVAALLLWIAAASAHAQAAQSSAADALNRRFQEAVRAQNEGDYAKAEQILRALRAQHPGVFAIDESLGMVLASREKYAEALPFLEAATKEQPGSDAAHANLGAALFELKRNKEALAAFEIAARLNPKNAATQQSLGRLLMETHEPARAAEAFAAALALEPSRTDLVLDRAQALVDAGRLDEAAGAAEQFPDAEDSAATHQLLGEIEEKRGNYKSAAQHLSRAAQLEPSEPNAWALGVEFLRHWTFDGAVPVFEAAVKQYPASTRMRVGLGAAYFGNGKYALAIPVFADLLDADANNKLYAEFLGISCGVVIREERPRCSSLAKYVEAHSDDALAATYEASMIIDGQSTDEQQAHARKLLETAIRVNPKLAEAHLQLAMLDQNQTMWGESVPQLQEALKLKPDLAKAHYRLALAYWRTGRKDLAKEEMDLQKKYHQQEQDDLNNRLKQVTIFLVDVKK
ncbi:MAG TPA: tetratricopeptide repeat protein [Terracidiphilus sp.]